MIDKIGKIEREVDSDLFSSVVHHIIGQQISTKAPATIWQRMQDDFGVVNVGMGQRGKRCKVAQHNGSPHESEPRQRKRFC